MNSDAIYFRAEELLERLLLPKLQEHSAGGVVYYTGDDVTVCRRTSLPLVVRSSDIGYQIIGGWVVGPGELYKEIERTYSKKE
jgi:hypothetical protein